MEKKIRITQIYTNGVLVTDSLLERLKKILAPQIAKNGPKTEFCLSFDGVGTHDDIRGIKGTELETIKAIERIVAHGFPVRIETVLYKKNVGNMVKTLDLMSEKGVESWKISGVGDTGKWLETGGTENLSIEETFDCYMDLLKHFICVGRPLNIQMGGFYSCGKGLTQGNSLYSQSTGKCDEGFLKQYSCNTCRFIRYLLSDGTLLPCIPMTGSAIHKDMPNIRDKSLGEALKDHKLWEIVSIKVKDLVKKNKECADCEYLGKCNIGCRSCSLIYNESVFAKDPFTCYYWKNKYSEKIAETIRQIEVVSTSRYVEKV